MKFRVQANQLAYELRRCEKIAPTRPQRPILSHVLLHASEDEKLHLAATDGELGLATQCPAIVQEVGAAVALPVKHLGDLISSLPDGPVQFTAEPKQQIRIEAGTFTTKLQTRLSEDFPTLPVPDGSPTTRLSGEVLRAMVRKVRRAISDTDKRYFLNGALLVVAETIIGLVATDGKRLALAETPYTDGPKEPRSTIIATKALDAVLQESDTEVTFSLTKNHIFFASRASILSALRIEQPFPAYQRIVPKTNDKICSVTREGLLAAVRRVMLVNREDQSITVTLGPNTLHVAARHMDVGEAEESVMTDYAGDVLKVGLSGLHLADFLELATSPHVKLHLKDETTALLLKDGTEDYLTVIQLMRA
jgi:DNA polymerase-3 subunit beta